MAFTTRPTLQGTFGMVSSTHWIASSAGMAMLERGGNAFDAAVATGFVLHLVEPHLNGPGGDLTAIICLAGADDPVVLCGQGPAPREATISRYRELGHDVIPGSGPLAAAVPGAVDAWLVLLRDHGTLPLDVVLEPAIGYAMHGAPMVARVGEAVETVRDLFETDWPTSAAHWLPHGRAPEPGQLVSNPAHGGVLERLIEAAKGAPSREVGVERAREAWSRGFVAEAIETFGRTTVRCSGVEQPVLVRGQDLVDFSATWEAPAMVEVFGHRVAKTGPWGQGPVLLQMLNILEALGEPGALDVDDVSGIHACVEAVKLAMADREAWYGDSAPVPLQALLSKEYAAERASLIGDVASLELRPGSPDGLQPRISALATAADGGDTDAAAGEPTVDASGRTNGDTCHVDVVDRWGNVVSVTPSGGWLMSSPVIPGLGFPLGSRLQMSRLEEGLPTTLMPGRRPRTTLTPTLVQRDGVAVMACGSPGGDQQEQWQLPFLLRTLVGGQELQEAIDAPTFHTLSLPGSFWPRTMEPGVVVAEDRIPAPAIEGLREKGHIVRLSGDWSLGRLCAVTREPETEMLRAGANPRGMQGYAVGR